MRNYTKSRKGKEIKVFGTILLDPLSAVIEFAHDMDIGRCGLALDELGYFSDKLVYVELRPN